MNKPGMISMLFAAAAFAQQPAPPTDLEKPTTYRIYQTKYLNNMRALQVANFVTSISETVESRYEQVIHGIVLKYRGPSTANIAAQLDKAEALVRRFDVPEPAPPAEKEIEVTIQLVRAYSDARSGSTNVPPELEPVVKQMKGALPYASFRLVDTIQAVALDGLALQDAMPKSAQSFYNFAFHGVRVSDDGKTLRVGDFHFGIKVPVLNGTGTTYQDESITTPLTLKEGQKLVLGKLRFADDDMFVVLSSKAK